MKLLHLDGFGTYSASGRGEELHAWPGGELREVSDADGAYLLETFPGRFQQPAPARVVKPMAAPVVKSAPKLIAPDVLHSSGARDLCSSIGDGYADHCLAELDAMEAAQKRPRRSVLKAIKERRAALEG